MPDKNYHTAIIVNATPEEAMNKIAQVKKWWAKNVTGNTAATGDRFKVDFGKTFVDFEVSELIPGKKIVWEVKDCNLHWISNKKEWRGTTVVFAVSARAGQTQIEFTHTGLTPDAECYNDCATGWNEHFGESLLQFVNEGKGIPV